MEKTRAETRAETTAIGQQELGVADLLATRDGSQR